MNDGIIECKIASAIAECRPDPSVRDLADIADLYGTTFPEVYRLYSDMYEENPGREIKKENEVKKMGKSSLTTSEVRKIDEWRSEGVGWIEIAERLGRKNPKSLNACYVYAKQKLGEEPVRTRKKSKGGLEAEETESRDPGSERQESLEEKKIEDVRDEAPEPRSVLRELNEPECSVDKDPERTERKLHYYKLKNYELHKELVIARRAAEELESQRSRSARQPALARFAPELSDVMKSYGYEGTVRRITVDYHSGGLLMFCHNADNGKKFSISVTVVSDDEAEYEPKNSQ